MSFRLIDSGACGAAFNMALDEALALSVKQGLTPPAVRFYGWDQPSLSLGRFQKKEHFLNKGGGLDLDFIKESGLPVVVRPTGGRTVLHGNELTYSLVSRYEGAFGGKDLFGCYAVISSAIEKALRRFGVPVEVKMSRERISSGKASFLTGEEEKVSSREDVSGRQGKKAGGTIQCFGSVSYAEMTANGRKIVGSAQRRWTGGFLQQGSIPFEIDEHLGGKVFRGAFNSEVMAGLATLVHGASPSLFKRLLAEGFEEVLGVPLEPSVPDPQELALALELLPGYKSACF